MLLPLGVAASAQASTIYDFHVDDLVDPSLVVAAGSFTTDCPASDPGYDLLVSMTFDFVTDTNGTVHSGPFTTQDPFGVLAWHGRTTPPSKVHQSQARSHIRRFRGSYAL